MKKCLFRTSILFAVLFIASALGSCKKSSSSTGDEKDWDVFYRKKTTGSNLNELWSIHIDGTNDHKIAIPLPAGWQLADKDMALLTSGITVLAYNSTSNQNGMFFWDFQSTTANQLLLTPGAEDMELLGQISTGGTKILYSRHNANGQPELWQIDRNGIYNDKMNIVLPANTSIANDDEGRALSSTKSYIFLLTRFEDSISHAITYPIYRCNPDGTGVALLVGGEAGRAPALQDAKYWDGLLYSKINENTLASELWLVNADGTNKHLLNLSLPVGMHLQNREMAKLSRVDHSLIYLTTTASDNTVGQVALYSANSDGSKPKLIKQFPVGTEVAIQDFEQKVRID